MIGHGVNLHRILPDKYWWRLANGELVKIWRGEDPDGKFGGVNRDGSDAYPATEKYGSESVQLTKDWWGFIRRINTAAGWHNGRRVNGGWLNSAGTNREIFGGGSIVPDDTEILPKSEPVSSVGNVVNVLEIKNGRAWIEVFDVRKPPPDPAIVNPKTMPWLFCRFTSINNKGEIGLAPNGVEFFFPLLSHNGTGWFYVDRLEKTDGPPQWAATPPKHQETNTMKMPTGKGMYVWQIARLTKAYGGNAAFAQAMKAAGVRRVEVKVADSINNYNQRPIKWNLLGQATQYADDLIEPFVAALKAEGIEVWGWVYIYGKVNVEAQVKAAVRQFQRLGLRGIIVNAEKEFFGYGPQASQYMNLLKALLPGVAIGFTSFRFPTNFPNFPWAEFLRFADFVQPQVYWEGASNAVAQLTRSINEHREFTSAPMLPIGPAYLERGWQPTPAQMDAFHAELTAMGLSGWSWWEAWHAWNLGLVPVIAKHGPPVVEPEPPIPTPETPGFEEIPEDPADPDQGKFYFQAGYIAGMEAAAEAVQKLKSAYMGE